MVVVSALAGLGFLLSKNNNPRQKNVSYLGKVSNNFKPSGDNIFDNKRSQQVWNEQQELADKIFAKSKNSLKTNYMIAGPPVPIFNKVDGTDKSLPVEYTGGLGLKQKAEDIEKSLKSKIYKPQFDPKVNDLEIPSLYKDFAAVGGWQGISLAGNPVDRQSFFHNNMVPFFGGTAKQNVQDTANQTILETFTGNDPNYSQKVEVKRDDFFQPVANLSNVYGMQNLDGYFLDRYIAGNLRNNQAPVEPIRVGPGLNQGYTAEPSGGVQQANTLDFITPKTVNELRVKTNPKSSYEGVVIPGSSVTGMKPGKVGIVQKNQPDTFYVNSPDRLFTTVGDIHGPTQRPTQIVKFTNRKTTELKSRIGPAAPAATGSQQQLKPAFRKSSRFNFAGAGPRNQQSIGKWGINGPNAEIPNDYGRSAIKVKPNSRMCTGNKMHVLNFNPINKFNRAPQKPNVRHTRKMNVVGNNRWAGNFQSTGPKKGKVYDPNDLPRTTIKEQNIDNNHNGFFQSSGPNKGQVYDPNDVLRTTIKEQNIDNNHNGFFQSSGPNKGQVYDPNDILRTTIKEQNIDNNHNGFFQSSGPNKGQVYDPNDVLRTTIKEQNIDNNHNGFFQSSGPNKGQVYDPNDVLRTTIKEQNIDNKYLGGFKGRLKGMVYDPNRKLPETIKQQVMIENNMGNYDRQQKGGGYKNVNMTVKNTQRLTTSVPYVGDAKGPSQGGYRNIKVKAKNTSRQFMSNKEVKGNAGPASVTAPMSYGDYYNAEIKSIREQVAVGRKPAHQGPKIIVSKDEINMKTSRHGDVDNERIEGRGVMSNKVYNSIPQKNQFGETHHKDQLPNAPLADRINPEILDAFRKNPYTQSLHSYAFN